MSKSSYSTDRKPTECPPYAVDGYNSYTPKTVPPSAAKFNKGATSIEEIRRATEARREHSRALSDPGRKGWEKRSPLS
jgi:hypothetical protein